MLKKTNARPAGASSGNRNSGVMRLFKVLAVQDDGLVISYADSQDQGTYFMQATPSFVEQKNKAANFMAKSPGKEMHKKFYHALMRPTTNAEHQFRKGQDILSAKVYSSNGTKTVEGYGELPKVALGGGFVIFARAETEKKDAFDDAITRTTPADEIVQGWARIVHDPEAVNRATGDKGSSWIEVISEKGSPATINDLLDRLQEVASSKRGPSVFVRILNENGDNDMQTTVYPGKDAAEVAEEINSIRDLGLTPDRIVSWEIQPRIYLRPEFLVSDTAAPAKIDRLRRDLSYTYGVKLEDAPFETEAVQRGERRAAGEGFAYPMAVSLTMYSNESTNGEWQSGSQRAVVPLSGERLHSKQLFMTPEQRERAALAAGAEQQGPSEDAPAAQAPRAAAPAAPTPTAAQDMDFGSGDMNFGSSN